MSRTMFGGAAPRPAAVAPTSDFITPRISARDIGRFLNRDVILVGIATDFDTDKGIIAQTCGISGEGYSIYGVPPTCAPAQRNEITVHIDGSGNLTFLGLGQLNDDFDFEMYGNLLVLMHGPHKELFY